MFGGVRGLVSKEKRRYQVDGFDLDLTYMGVDDRIVAMGFPSESMEAAFRNPMKEVLKLLDSKHKDHYKVYNLCSERGYDSEKFHNRVSVFPFDDHNAPPFEMIRSFCADVAAWLAIDNENIAVIHCKAGKGRTGLMICAWFLYSRMWPTPDEALQYYASARTYDKKGVTIPSQLRYVRYFHESLALTYSPRTLLLTKIFFHTLPKAFGVSDIDFKVFVGKTEVFHYKNFVETNKLKDEPKIHKVGSGESKKKKDKKKEKKDKDIKLPPGVELSTKQAEDENGLAEEVDTVEFDLGVNGIPVCGDVKLDFERQDKRIFMFWFNTFFVKDLNVIIDKRGLDKAVKDCKSHKSYDEHFKVELQFAEMTETPRKLVSSASSSSVSTISQPPTPKADVSQPPTPNADVTVDHSLSAPPDAAAANGHH